MIVVNANEASRHKPIVDYLISDGHAVEVVATDIADFDIFGKEETWIAERKTQADLRGSLQERRGWEQIKALADAREQGFFPFIIFESGYMWDNSAGRKVTWETFLKRHPQQEKNYYAMITGVAKWQVPLIPTKDEIGTAILLGYIDDMLGKTKERKDFPLRQGMKKDWSIAQKRLYTLEAFGHETAKALLANYDGSIEKIILDKEAITILSEIKLASGRRLGESKANDIREVLFD